MRCVGCIEKIILLHKNAVLLSFLAQIMHILAHLCKNEHLADMFLFHFAIDFGNVKRYNTAVRHQCAVRKELLFAYGYTIDVFQIFW